MEGSLFIFIDFQVCGLLVLESTCEHMLCLCAILFPFTVNPWNRVGLGLGIVSGYE